MQLTPRETLLQCAHVFQQHLFPQLEAEVGPLSPQFQLLSAVMSLVPLGPALSARRASTGRPARDRAALATAFFAKSILNLSTTRQLMDRLRCDAVLRRLCGWNHVKALPHESKFSRAFSLFATSELPQQLHAAVIAATQHNRLVGHIARDSTAIDARERVAESLLKQKRQAKAQNPKRKPKRKTPRQKGSMPKAKAAERGTRIQCQRHQNLDAMLADLPRQCDIGAKKNSAGHENYWRGYKLHLDVADGQIPISALLTSASVHDSQVAIPLMTVTSGRVQYLYELMDSAYDAGEIHAHCKQLSHVPIIAVHSRRGTQKPSPLTKAFPAQPTPQLTWAQQDRYKERTMSERVNARLKDEFGASHIRVRGPVKVMAHLMFGVLALAVDQWLRIAANQT